MKEKGKNRNKFSFYILNRHTNIPKHKSCETESTPVKEKGKNKQFSLAYTY